MKFYPYSINMQGYQQVTEICPLNGFVAVNPDKIPLALPAGLLDKCIKAVVVGSGDVTNAVYMVNFLRADTGNNAVDQEPLIIAYHSGDTGVDLTAGFIHHGSWEGRTVYPGTGFFQAIEGSGISEYYPYVGVPDKEQGNISELAPDSHKQAFWNGVKIIKAEK